MTGPAALTDEELAAIVRAIHFYYGTQTRTALRLIAALGASRAEVERLRGDADVKQPENSITITQHGTAIPIPEFSAGLKAETAHYGGSPARSKVGASSGIDSPGPEQDSTDPFIVSPDISRSEVERLRADEREEYARAELAENQVIRLKSDSARLRAVADDLAIALHQCSAFLPVFLSENGEEGRKLARALAVNEQVDAAMRSYCIVTDTRRAALQNRTVTKDVHD